MVSMAAWPLSFGFGVILLTLGFQFVMPYMKLHGMTNDD